MSHESRPWISYVTNMNASCRIYEWVMSRIRMSPVTHTNESSRTCEWVMSNLRMNPVVTYEWIMSHICMSHVAHTNESCRTIEGIMSRARINHDVHTNDSTYVWVTSHVRMSHITHTKESCHTHIQWTTSYIRISHVAFMGLPRSVKSIKLLVSFAKEPYKRDAIVQKRPGARRRGALKLPRVIRVGPNEGGGNLGS